MKVEGGFCVVAIHAQGNHQALFLQYGKTPCISLWQGLIFLGTHKTLLWGKIQGECALYVVGTHCSGKCKLLLLLDYGDMSLDVQFELVMQGNTGGVLCAVGGRMTCCYLCSTNSSFREAQTSALRRI
jgi:hypothetical protein